MFRWIWSLSLLAALGCAHSSSKEGTTYYLGRYDQLSRAPAAAYAADGFFVQRKMTHRPVRPQHPYFHKVCELERSPSQRNYACSKRPWVSDPLGY